MKKFLGIMMAALLMLGGTPALAAADTDSIVLEQAEQDAQTRAIAEAGCILTRHNSTQMKLYVTCLTNYSADIIDFYVVLQRWNGSGWTNVQSFSANKNGNYLSMTKYVSPTKGYRYRAKAYVSTASAGSAVVTSGEVNW
ncbi:MAG: hypothetical protein ACLRP7_04390 [Christensenellales bacterium]|jgi:hypothetical protein|nr:hypothetical protein [Clostridiales bacterium]